MTDTEYIQMCQERNEAFLKEHGREMQWEDVVRGFGGYPMGQSIIGNKKGIMSRSEDDGLKEGQL